MLPGFAAWAFGSASGLEKLFLRLAAGFSMYVIDNS